MKYAVLLFLTVPLLVFSMKESKTPIPGDPPFDQPCCVETMDGKRIKINASAAALIKLAPVRTKTEKGAPSSMLSRCSHVNSDYSAAIDPFLRILSAKASAPDPSLPLERLVGVPRFIKELRKISLQNAYQAAHFLREIPLRSVINFSAYATLAQLFKRHFAQCKTPAQKDSFFEQFSTLGDARNIVREYILVEHCTSVNLAEIHPKITREAGHFLDSDGSGYGVQVQASLDEPTPLTYHWNSDASQKPLVYAVSGFGEIKDTVRLSAAQYVYLQNEPNILCGWKAYFERKPSLDSPTSVCIYDVNASKKIWERKNEFSERWGAMVPSSDGKVVYIALKNACCGRYDIRDGTYTATYRSFRPVSKVQVSKDGCLMALVEAGDPSSINVYDIRSSSKEPLYITFFRGSTGILAHQGGLVITPTLFKNCMRHVLNVYDISSKTDSSIALSEAYVCANTTFCMSPDSRWIAFVSEEKGLSIWPFDLLIEGKALHAIRSWPWIKQGPVVFTPDSHSLLFFYAHGERGFKRLSFELPDATTNYFEKWYRTRS